MKTFGIDVSKWQGKFNFAKAKNEGVKFVVLKAGGSDLGRYKDSKFDAYYNECKNLGLKVGAYYFGKDKTVNDARKSAEHLVKILRGKTFDLPIYYDVEGAMLTLSKTTLSNIILEFCGKLSSYGYKVGIYSTQNAFNNQMHDGMFVNYSHWVAKWSRNEPGILQSGAKVDLWQFGGESNFIRTTKVAGVTCDQDYCYINFEKNCEGNIANNVKVEPTTNAIKFIYKGYDLSPVFDAKYYANKNLDVRNAYGYDEKKLFEHFCIFGMKEQRQASSTFNVKSYKAKYDDLAKVYGDDMEKYYIHYCVFGIKEGRSGM